MAETIFEKPKNPASTALVPVKQTSNSPAEKTAENKQSKANGGNDMDQKLDKLLDNSEQILFTTKSAFPFDLFPDTVSIDINQVHISTKAFFKSKREHSIAIKDISDVFVETSPWYATLKIIDKDFVENSVQVTFLKKNEALRAKKIIQGLIIGAKEGIDFTRIRDKKLIDKLEELGSPSNPADHA